MNPRSLVANARNALRGLDQRFGTRLDTCLILGVQIALRAPSGFPRLRLLLLGLRYSTGRLDGPSSVELPSPSGPARVRLPDAAAYLVLAEIFALDQYRREPGPDPATILDLGANIGASALFYRLLYPSARIICVEADPEITAILRENTAALGVEVVHAAVAAAAGEIEFFPSPQSWSGSILDTRGGGETAVRVPAVSLDELIDRYAPDLIKIDIEGAEYDVFAASEKATSVRVVVGEIHTPEHDPQTTALLQAFSDFTLDVEDYGELTLFRAVRQVPAGNVP